jgi:GNAT superfamily N-acetyltransferase
VQRVRNGLEAYNRSIAGDDRVQPLTVFLRDAEGVVVGGLLGNTYWGWLAIEIFWIDERARGHGHGTAMLRAAEDEARRRGCRFAHVDTQSFQAPAFYERHGYVEWGRLDELPVGHARIYLRKAL